MKILLTITALAGLICGISNYIVVVSGNDEIGISLLGTHLLIMVSLGVLLIAFVFPRIIYRASEQELAATAQFIGSSGQSIAAIRTGGRIGWLEFRGPLIRVSLYPGGIIVEPFLLTSFGVPETDFADVGFTSNWHSLGQRRLTITHRARNIASPILLWCDEDHPFATELIALAGREPTTGFASTG